MALDITSLFTDIGKFIIAINQIRDLGISDGSPNPDLNALEDAIESRLNTSGRHDILSGIDELFDSFRDSSISWADALVAKITQRITHRTTVLEQLDGLGPNPSLEEILRELFREIVNQGDSFDATSISLGDVSAEASNVGNGRVLIDRYLDGWNSPGVGMAANLEYVGLESELSAGASGGETMSITCEIDNDSGGVAEGEELFTWQGKIKPSTSFGWNTDYSGEETRLATLNSHQIIANKDFESWASQVPESWDLDDGIGGTHVIQQNSASNVYRGSSSLELKGETGQTTIQISQTLPLGLLDPFRRYLVACWIKGNASVAAGTLTIQFESPSGGYTAAAGIVEIQTIEISGTPTGGSYTITYDGNTTAAIAYNADSATVQIALRLLPGLESVTIAELGTTPNFTHKITMTGCQVGKASDWQMTSTSSLTGGVPVITHGTLTPGEHGERIQLGPANLTHTGYALRFFWINIPSGIPDDLELVIKTTGTLTDGQSIYIDSLAVGPVVYANGINAAVIAGSTPFVTSDRFTFNVTNAEQGTFQTFFKRAYRFQMPSDDSGAETISDDLAEPA